MLGDGTNAKDQHNGKLGLSPEKNILYIIDFTNWQLLNRGKRKLRADRENGQGKLNYYPRWSIYFIFPNNLVIQSSNYTSFLPTLPDITK